jgi:hypothetical protein
VFEQKCIIACLLTSVPEGITGLQGLRLHLRDLPKGDIRRDIDIVKELVRVICNLSPRDRGLLVVGCMT